jgi:hypothetical protein
VVGCRCARQNKSCALATVVKEATSSGLKGGITPCSLICFLFLKGKKLNHSLAFRKCASCKPVSRATFRVATEIQLSQNLPPHQLRICSTTQFRELPQRECPHLSERWGCTRLHVELSDCLVEFLESVRERCFVFVISLLEFFISPVYASLGCKFPFEFVGIVVSIG